MLLIVDDNAGVRRTMRLLLEEVDDQIIECSDGAESIDAYEKHRPDFVLMDINMQPMDGLTAMHEILKRHPHARVIVVSQFQDARTREFAITKGAYAFVGKEDLMKLRELVAPKASRTELSGMEPPSA